MSDGELRGQFHAWEASTEEASRLDAEAEAIRERSRDAHKRAKANQDAIREEMIARKTHRLVCGRYMAVLSPIPHSAIRSIDIQPIATIPG